MKVTHSIKVKYKSTSDAETAKEWIKEIPDVFSADLETAVKYSERRIKEAKEIAKDKSESRELRILNQAIAKATALGHPSHCTITHCSIGLDEENALVFIIDNQEVADVILDFLVETDKTQVWHNYCYDGKFLYYYGGGTAKNVEDTQVFAKTLVNHVEVHKAAVSLKILAGDWYGDWAIAKDNFSIEHQYDEKVLKYAATDAVATFKLWNYLNEFIS